MPEKVLNMDRDELLDLIQKLRTDMEWCEDAEGLVLDWGKRLEVDISPKY